MKFSKVLKVLVAAMFSGLVVNAQSGRTLSLREAVETGTKNNLLVNQANLNMQRAGVSWQQARGNMIPSLTANIGHNFRSGRGLDPVTNAYVNQEQFNAGWDLNSDVTIFNGFRLWNQLRGNAYAYDAGKWEWQQAKDNLTLDIILAYLQILTNQDQLALARIQTAQMQEQVNRLTILNEQGAIVPSELTDLQGQLSGNIINEINSKNALETAKLSLAQLLNIPYDSTMQVERLPVEQFDMNYASTPDSIFAIASEQLAMAKAPELRRLSAEKFVQAARGNLYPQVGLGGGIGTAWSSTARDGSDNKIGYYDQLKNNYGTGVSVGVFIPILNNFVARNQVKRAKIDLKETELIESNTQIRLKQLIERDHFNMVASVNRYRALVDQVTALTQSFRAAEARFNAGAGNSIDFLTARNNLDRANINLIVARYDYALRTKILDFYQGRQLW
jgi:outer membrane protein